MKNYNTVLLTDFYKQSHMAQYPKGIEQVYSTWTPRSLKYFTQQGYKSNKVVVFGVQGALKILNDSFNENFFSRPKEEVIAEYTRIIKHTIGENNININIKSISDLHDLGYLPIEVKSLPEGSLVDEKIPYMTIENTHKDFFWITNFIETTLSCNLWQPATSATIAYNYRTLINEFAKDTCDNGNHSPFQLHDFSYRGMGSDDSASASGAGHLLSSYGTDTVPAILYLEKYYNANVEKELVGTSIPATEHSVMCAGGANNEFDTIKRLITEVYPNGFVSVVSDTWDLWKVLSDIIKPLKNEILARDGRVVVRPDSGNPADIICGLQFPVIYGEPTCFGYEMPNINPTTKPRFTFEGLKYEFGAKENKLGDSYFKELGYNVIDENEPQYKGVIEILWEIFGGKINSKGFKELDSHIGAIYGDSITIKICEEICSRLKEKGFASSNIVFGIGSYTYQYNTRDTLGFALKSTNVVINGTSMPIFKDPKTDSGFKKSALGRVKVHPSLIADDKNLYLEDEDNFHARADLKIDLLATIFKNGKFLKEETLSEIRNRLGVWKND